MKIKKYRSDGKRISRPIRIKITTADIANYTNSTENCIRTAISRSTLDFNQPLWDRFWSLVRFLEKKGLRPNNASNTTQKPKE